MADDTILNLGVGGDVIVDEDVGGGRKVPVSKIYLGAHGVNGGPVTDSQPFPVKLLSSLIPSAYDFISLGYDIDGNITSAVYKTGGSGGTVVATLAITYSGGLISTVTRS